MLCSLQQKQKLSKRKYWKFSVKRWKVKDNKWNFNWNFRSLLRVWRHQNLIHCIQSLCKVFNYFRIILWNQVCSFGNINDSVYSWCFGFSNDVLNNYFWWKDDLSWQCASMVTTLFIIEVLQPTGQNTITTRPTRYFYTLLQLKTLLDV